MVTHSRTSLRPDQLRTLNQPQPFSVICNERGDPAAIRMQGRKRRVHAVKDRWRLDDEWWRRPIHRIYYLVELEEGILHTVYLDLESGEWYRQRETVSAYVPHTSLEPVERKAGHAADPCVR